MRDPVAFLWARMDEETEAASRAAFCWGGNWTAVSDGDDWADLRADGSPRVAGSEDVDVLAHAALWDPVRVLAEVAAKQAILTLWEQREGRWTGEFDQNDEIPRVMVRPYSDHPDFDPTWRAA